VLLYNQDVFVAACCCCCCLSVCLSVCLCQAIDLLCEQFTLSEKQLVHNAMHALSGERGGEGESLWGKGVCLGGRGGGVRGGPAGEGAAL